MMSLKAPFNDVAAFMCDSCPSILMRRKNIPLATKTFSRFPHNCYVALTGMLTKCETLSLMNVSTMLYLAVLDVGSTPFRLPSPGLYIFPYLFVLSICSLVAFTLTSSPYSTVTLTNAALQMTLVSDVDLSVLM